MIDSRDLSVVVQGPVVAGQTAQCLRSLRRFLPGCEIILSTWEGTRIEAELSDCPPDEVIYNADPGNTNWESLRASGGAIAECMRLDSNFNRQLVSTASGLKVASRPWALKFRSDMLLTGDGFLKVAERFDAPGGAMRVFDKRIVTLQPLSPDRCCRLYFVADFCFFGTTPDLRKLFSCPPVPGVEAFPDFSHLGNSLCLFPEQYLLTGPRRRAGPLRLAHSWDWTPEEAEHCRRFFAENTIPLSMEEFGTMLMKYPGWGDLFREPMRFNWLMRVSHSEWQVWYRDYCDPRHAVPDDPDLRTKLQMQTAFRAFLKSYLRSTPPYVYDIDLVHQKLAGPFYRWFRQQADALRA